MVKNQQNLVERKNFEKEMKKIKPKQFKQKIMNKATTPN